jgi:hypothetical protein
MTPSAISKAKGAIEYSEAMQLLMAHCEEALRELSANHPARAQIEQALVAATLSTGLLRNNWTPLSNLAMTDAAGP